MEASRTKQDLHYYFHQDVFNSVNWKKDTEKSLKQLYEERARRIREKYDRVVLLFSGGIDSTTVLESFLNQGLQVDEIVTTWSVKAAEEWALPEANRNPENYIGEWNYCIQPRLQKLKDSHPNIKITIIDSTYDILNDVYSDEDFFIFDSYHNLPGMNRWSPLVKYIEQVCADNENTVILLGLDKPQFMYEDGNLYLYFLDVNMHLRTNNKIRYEYFYYDPDAIDIMRCQSHRTLEFFKKNPNMRCMLKTRDDDFLTILNAIIYPTYDPNRFQARKQKFMIFNEQQSWAWKLTQYQNGKYEDRFNSNWKNILSAVDPKYIRYKNNIFDGLHGHISSKHLIGKIDV